MGKTLNVQRPEKKDLPNKLVMSEILLQVVLGTERN